MWGWMPSSFINKSLLYWILISGCRKLLSETFSLFNLVSLFSLTLCICWRLSLCSKKTLKVNIGLGLHIGSEPNPTVELLVPSCSSMLQDTASAQSYFFSLSSQVHHELNQLSLPWIFSSSWRLPSTMYSSFIMGTYLDYFHHHEGYLQLCIPHL